MNKVWISHDMYDAIKNNPNGLLVETKGETALEIKVTGVVDYIEILRNDKYKIRIGDVLYESSKSYNKVFEWRVLDMWLEEFIGGNKTIVKCSNGTWSREFFVADILAMCKTKEEAEELLKEATE